MQKIFQKIANTLMLYSYQIESYGLVHGKMGIIIYLYQYANIIQDRIYSDFADNLLDQVLKESPRGPIDFENGLAGIGWGVNYLLKEKLIEGDPDEIFGKVDAKIFSYLQNGNPEHAMEGQGLYLLSRLESTLEEKKILKQITKLLDHHIEYYKEITRPISLYHLNSFIYLLDQVDHLNICQKQIQLSCPLINTKVIESLENNKYEFSDLKITKDLFHHIESFPNSSIKEFTSTESHIIFPETAIHIEDLIKYLWLNLIYFNAVPSLPVDISAINQFITEKQESLTPSDFTLYKGLTGMGVGLINMNFK